MASLYETLPSFLAATVAFAIGASVFLRDRGRDEFLLFALFCFNLGLFHLSRFFEGFSGLALFGWAAQSIGLLLPWSADRLFTSLVPDGRPRTRSRLRAALLALLLVAQAAALLVLVQRPDLGADLHRESLWQLVSIALNVYVLSGLLLVVARIRNAARAASGTAVGERLAYLAYASLAALALGALGAPLERFEVTILGPLVTAVYLYFVAQTLLRERLLELPELAAKIATLALLVLGTSALYALLLLWIPVRDEAGGVGLFLFNLGVGSYAVIVLVDPVRNELESRVEAWFFRDRSTLRTHLSKLRIKLLNVIDPDEMVQAIGASLDESNRATRVAIYLLDRHGTHLRLRYHTGQAAPPSRLDLAARRPLVTRWTKQGAVLRDVVQREREREPAERSASAAPVLEALAEVQASLAVPILRHEGQAPEALGELMGAIFLDDERLLEPFSRDEVELLEGVAGQAAITLENSAAYEQRKERERLAALGEMSAGLAHEIRNPLGAIKGAVQVLEPGLEQVDRHTREFFGVIVEEVDRLNRVVTQFLSYSRPYSGELGEVALDEVVQATLRMIDPSKMERLRVELSPLPPVHGDAEALRQVLLNLVRNALEATGELDPPGTVWIEGGVREHGLPSGDAACVSVRDNGPGINAHTMSHLFVPFHTTKAAGTGMGLPISQRIVENHHGVIEVVNLADGGARFSVLLPLGDISASAKHPVSIAARPTPLPESLP